jgi:hypothetical protein
MSKLVLSIALALVGVAAATLSLLHFPRAQAAVQHAVRPGELSQPHAFLANNCAACHTAVKGVEAKNCIVCHADNKSVLQREPSAFHADIATCVDCHLEHQGRVPSTTKMDHVALVRLGATQLKGEPSRPGVDVAQIKRWLEETTAAPPSALAQLQHGEVLLNCATCHQTKDRHFGLFGNDCAQCHGTTKWTLPEFRHPSPVSQSCAQCHQAPPSHYMMHFKMISMTIARVEKAEVNQCFLCHQTTSWNDIKGVGFYKHH